jgi:leader peptidase (prepilin peptidase) / N-methyltransferase
MSLISELEQVPALLWLATLIIGLLVGSFLNVVIHRLPLQLSSVWRRESMDFLGVEPEESERESPQYSIVFPSSQCPKCHQPIKPWHNIPVFSYLFLRGKCAHCATAISLQYPLIELLTALATCFIVYQYGLSAQAGLIILFTWALIALTGIDYNEQLLPDIITLPLLWAGLLVNLSGMFATLSDAVIGAAAGYLVLWSIFWLFKLVTGKEGMGHGDFKLLAALGAWMGWQQLPLIILLSSIVGALLGIAAIVFSGRDSQKPMPFGPYLAVAGWIALIWGEAISSRYLAIYS